LKGDVDEVRLGDRAATERWRLRLVTKDADRIKPIESLLAVRFRVFASRMHVTNLQHTDQPFGFAYSFEADSYAKSAGNLLLVRPRVLGSKSSGILETKEPRKFPIEFDGPRATRTASKSRFRRGTKWMICRLQWTATTALRVITRRQKQKATPFDTRELSKSRN